MADRASRHLGHECLLPPTADTRLHLGHEGLLVPNTHTRLHRWPRRIKHHEEDAKHNKQGTTNLHGGRQGQQIMGISLVPTHQDEEALNDTRYHGIHCGVRETVSRILGVLGAEGQHCERKHGRTKDPVQQGPNGTGRERPETMLTVRTEKVLHAVAVADHQRSRKNADRRH